MSSLHSDYRSREEVLQEFEEHEDCECQWKWLYGQIVDDMLSLQTFIDLVCDLGYENETTDELCSPLYERVQGDDISLIEFSKTMERFDEMEEA